MSVEAVAQRTIGNSQVRLHKDLLGTNVPYSVTVDQIKAGELFDTLGGLSRWDAVIRHGSRFALSRGIYNLFTKGISINTMDSWSTYKKALQLSYRILEHKKKPKDKQFKDILVTKRLSSYLSSVREEDKDRAFCFAEKILRKGVQRQLNSTFLHETKHAMDFSRSRLNIPLLLPKLAAPNIAYFGGMNILETYLNYNPELDPVKIIPLWLVFMATQLEYFIDPAEMRARRFAKKLKYDYRWNSILSFTPKSEPSRNNVPE